MTACHTLQTLLQICHLVALMLEVDDPTQALRSCTPAACVQGGACAAEDGAEP